MAPPVIHDSTRLDLQGRGSYERTVAGLKRLQNSGLDPGVICVINPFHDGIGAYQHFRDLEVKWIDFLLPDCTHDSKPRFYRDAIGTPVADYLVPVFDAWLEEDDPSIRVQVFADLVRRLLGGTGMTEAFGNRPISYVVVETAGEIEAMDGLRICGEDFQASGLNVNANSFNELFRRSALLESVYRTGVPLCDQCRSCPEENGVRGRILASSLFSSQRLRQSVGVVRRHPETARSHPGQSQRNADKFRRRNAWCGMSRVSRTYSPTVRQRRSRCARRRVFHREAICISLAAWITSARQRRQLKASRRSTRPRTSR